jgi:hypothetical protein
MSNNNEHPNTPQTGDIVARAMPKRKFDSSSIEAVALLVAKSLTESEAARQLGYEPRQWFTFKSRGKNDERFSAALEKFRAARIEKLISRVEKSADGEGVKYPDFRAALALLAILDRRRFNVSQADTPPPQVPQISVNVLLSLREKCYGVGADGKPISSVTAGPQKSAKPEIVASVEQKALPEKCE